MNIWIGTICAVALAAGCDSAPDTPESDVSVSDGAVADGAVADGAVADGAVVDGAAADGALADGAAADGALADGAAADSGLSECADGLSTYYPDVDGDGLGDERSPIEACGATVGYVDNADDAEPDCASNDTDTCGRCAGSGPSAFFADLDGDGLGDPALEVSACEQPDGFVGNSDDEDPRCEANDVDACGVCGGAGPQPFWADQDGDGAGDPQAQLSACAMPDGFVAVAGDPEPRCATDNTDRCGVCGGADASLDCLGVCDGEAAVDGCNVCAGGTSGVDPSIADWDQDGRPDACDQCPVVPVERLVIQWTAVARFGNAGGPYTFQVILHSSGDFIFQYEVIEPFEPTASFGHQGEAGLNGVTLGVNSGYPRDHQVVYFRMNPEDDRTEVDYTVPKRWIDIAQSGRDLALEDDGAEVIELPWPFPFNGVQYQRLTVGANGVVGFAGPLPGPQNGELGQAGLGAFMAPFWDDLDPGRSGKVSVQFLSADCEQDCAGTFGGVAFADGCGLCVGGTTGRKVDESLDCNGDCNGQAYLDVCGECVGGQTGLPPAAPEDCASGPDLIVDQPYLQRTARLEYLDTVDQCLVEERCVTGLGRRKIIRFGTQIANIGNADLRLGAPGEGVDHWTYDDCHGHFHYEAYAGYDLVDLNTGEVLPIGSKSGFAVIDIGVYDARIAVDGCRGYNSRNQGITAGCQDTYSRNLQCQWVDVTGIPDGDYELRVTTNPDATIFELDYENNVASVRVRLLGDALDIIDE